VAILLVIEKVILGRSGGANSVRVNDGKRERNEGLEEAGQSSWKWNGRTRTTRTLGTDKEHNIWRWLQRENGQKREFECEMIGSVGRLRGGSRRQHG
jgi:hypothetical protein